MLRFALHSLQLGSGAPECDTRNSVKLVVHAAREEESCTIWKLVKWTQPETEKNHGWVHLLLDLVWISWLVASAVLGLGLTIKVGALQALFLCRKDWISNKVCQGEELIKTRGIHREISIDIYNYQILSLNQHSSICKTKCHDKENKNLHRCWFYISISKYIYIIDSISTFEWFVVRYIYVGLEKLPQHRLFVSIRLKIKHRRVKFWSPVKFSIIVKYPNVDWNHQSNSPEIKSKLLKFKC